MKQISHLTIRKEQMLALTFFHETFASSKTWKMDLVQLVPVTLFQKPAAWLVLSTKPQEEPEVANLTIY